MCTCVPLVCSQVCLFSNAAGTEQGGQGLIKQCVPVYFQVCLYSNAAGTEQGGQGTIQKCVPVYLLSILRSAPVVMQQVQSRVNKASYNNVYLLSVLRSAPIVMWQV